MRVRAGGALFAAFLATMMIPDQVTVIPRFLLVSRLGLLDTHAGLILMAAFSVYGVFLLRQSMIALPDSLIEPRRSTAPGTGGCSPASSCR